MQVSFSVTKSLYSKRISSLLQYFTSLTRHEEHVCVPFLSLVTCRSCTVLLVASGTERQDKESLFNSVLARGRRRGSQTRIFEVKACRAKIRQHKRRNRLMLAKGVKIIMIFLPHHRGKNKYWKD